MNNNNNSDTSHLSKNHNLITGMEDRKTMTVSGENYRRLQKLGFASESMNDVIEKMLLISEPKILNEMERAFQQQKMASNNIREQTTEK